MEKFSDSVAVYDKLVQDSEDHWLLGLVSFALVEEQRIEWIKHQIENTGQSPTHEEITQWYEQQTEGVLLRARDTAFSRVTDFSQTVSDAILEDFEEDVRNDIIVNEIKEGQRFWPQFAINVAGGFVGALLFAMFLALVAFFVFNDTSVVDLTSKMNDNNNYHEESSNKSANVP